MIYLFNKKVWLCAGMIFAVATVQGAAIHERFIFPHWTSILRVGRGFTLLPLQERIAKLAMQREQILEDRNRIMTEAIPIFPVISMEQKVQMTILEKKRLAYEKVIREDAIGQKMRVLMQTYEQHVEAWNSILKDDKKIGLVLGVQEFGNEHDKKCFSLGSSSEQIFNRYKHLMENDPVMNTPYPENPSDATEAPYIPMDTVK